MRREISVPCLAVLSCQTGQGHEIQNESSEVRVYDSVWPIGRDDLAVPAAFADRLMVLQRVERSFGGGNHLDIVPLEQGASAKGSLPARPDGSV